MTVNARAILINKKTLGTDSLVDRILQEPEGTEAKLYARAKHINNNRLKKQYVEASLLASTDLEKISNLLEMPLDVVTMYKDIFYDTIDLDKLSKMDLLNVSDQSEKLLKMWSLSQGLEFIQWRLGGKVLISPIEGLKDLFTTCIYKSKEAMFNGNASEASKESTKYIKLAMDLARLLKVWVLDSDAARQDIELALQEINPEFGSLADLETEMSTKENKKVAKETKTSKIDEIDANDAISSFSLADIMKENDE